MVFITSTAIIFNLEPLGINRWKDPTTVRHDSKVSVGWQCVFWIFISCVFWEFLKVKLPLREKSERRVLRHNNSRIWAATKEAHFLFWGRSGNVSCAENIPAEGSNIVVVRCLMPRVIGFLCSLKRRLEGDVWTRLFFFFFLGARVSEQSRHVVAARGGSVVNGVLEHFLY